MVPSSVGSGRPDVQQPLHSRHHDGGLARKRVGFGQFNGYVGIDDCVMICEAETYQDGNFQAAAGG